MPTSPCPPRRRWLTAGLLALTLAAGATHAAPSGPDQKLIDALIARVEGMRSLQFMRNGQPHSAAEAAKHMRAKLDHFRDRIATPEDFIDHCASRSEMTGRPYQVKTADGRLHDAKTFMLRELKALRQTVGP